MLRSPRRSRAVNILDALGTLLEEYAQPTRSLEQYTYDERYGLHPAMWVVAGIAVLVVVLSFYSTAYSRSRAEPTHSAGWSTAEGGPACHRTRAQLFSLQGSRSL